MDTRPVAVVTGARRGLGHETTTMLAEQGWRVVLTARHEGQAQLAADDAAKQAAQASGHDVEIVPFKLDVTSEADAAALAAFVEQRFRRLDALVNNAGAIFDDADSPALDQPPEILKRSFDTNVVGAFIVLRALRELLVRDGGANVVNVSSGMGALNEMEGGFPGYRLSKAALNALTRVMHAELSAAGVRVNSVCPGWVRTEMGGPEATRSLREGAAGIVWAATLGPDGPSGGFFRDGQRIDW